MVSHKPRRSLVPREHGHGVRIRQADINLSRDIKRFSGQNIGLSERDTVSDQADGARGLEQAVCSEPEPSPVGQKTRETSRLPARRGIKTGS